MSLRWSSEFRGAALWGKGRNALAAEVYGDRIDLSTAGVEEHFAGVLLFKRLASLSNGDFYDRQIACAATAASLSRKRIFLLAEAACIAPVGPRP